MTFAWEQRIVRERARRDATAADPSANDDSSQAATPASSLQPQAGAPLKDPHRLIRRYLDQAQSEAAPLGMAFRASPSETHTALRLARFFAGRGRLSRAAETLEACRAAGGKPRRLYPEGGALFMRMGDYRTAAQWFALGLSAEPDATGLLELHGQALDALTRDAADGVSPDQKQRYLRAMELLLEGKAQPAAARFAKLTRARPAYAPAWLGLRAAQDALGHERVRAAIRRDWQALSPGSGSVIKSLTDRRLSARGLVFDPRQPVRVIPRGEGLAPVETSEALQAGGNVLLTLAAAGAPKALEPVIALGAAGDQKTRFVYRDAPKYVAAIEGAALVGRGVVLDLKGEAPIEAQPPCHPTKAGFRPIGGCLVARPAHFLDGLCPIRAFDTPAFLMAGPTDTSFGDWILNFPPRLALAAAAGLDCPIVVSQGAPAPFIRMLVELGVDRRRIIQHDPYGVSLFPRLYAPSWPLPSRDEAMSDLFGVYRATAARRPAGPGERLYLSREGVPGRKLANEAEVRAAFERRGFRTIHPEALNLDAARALFAGAGLIGGPYGSAFLNVVHAQSPPAALALMPPGHNTFLDEIALWLGGNGSRFGYLFGEPAATAADPGRWTAPIAVVEAVLDAFLARAGEL